MKEVHDTELATMAKIPYPAIMSREKERKNVYNNSCYVNFDSMRNRVDK